MVAWLWSPIIFNPNGVEWLDVIKDFDGWLSWMMAGDDDPDKSWHAWWIQQNAVSGNQKEKVEVFCLFNLNVEIQNLYWYVPWYKKKTFALLSK